MSDGTKLFSNSFVIFLSALILVFIVVGILFSLASRTNEVIIYVSHDQDYSEPILNDFERDTGVRVRAVYDTESTKTTGLVNRLIEERPAKENGPTSTVAACESDLTLEDDVRHLHDCICRLPVFEKTLISLYLEDLGTSEMAAILGISEGNVRVKLHRTKKLLKDLWEENNNGYGS